MHCTNNIVLDTIIVKNKLKVFGLPAKDISILNDKQLYPPNVHYLEIPANSYTVALKLYWHKKIWMDRSKIMDNWFSP